MAIVPFNKLNIFVKDVAEKKHDLNNDVLKVALSNTAPAANNAVLADINEIAAGNGYSAGGRTATLSSSTQTNGLYSLILNSVIFTAVGGTIPTFRYAYLYNSTQATPLKPLIGYWDYGVGIILENGSSFTVIPDQVNGVLTIQ